MREEACFLDDITDTAAEADRIGFGGGAAFDKNVTLRRDEHAIDELQEGGLAAAAAAEENDGFGARDC